MATSRNLGAIFRAGLLPAAAAAAVLLLPQEAFSGGQGNGQYFARRDTIALGAGDAATTNIVTHTIDPWPPYARDYRLKFNGYRMLLGIERYKLNQSIEPRGLATQEIIESGNQNGQSPAPPPR